MPAWLIPALKAVLPHVGTIISAAGPVFSQKRPHSAASQAGAVQEQIAELQAAASENAAHIKELAEQLHRTIAAIEEAAVGAEARLRQAALFASLAAVLSVVALAVSLFVLFAR